MDENTITRFIQMDEMSVGGSRCVGRADVGRGQLELCGSNGEAYGRIGVRRSLGLPEDEA